MGQKTVSKMQIGLLLMEGTIFKKKKCYSFTFCFRFWSSIACAEEYKEKEDGKITQLIITSGSHYQNMGN